MNRLITCLLLMLVHLLPAQTRIDCSIKDGSTAEPLEFVNVGIPGKALGTVTDDKGHFVLNVPDSLAGQKIRISMIGYRTVDYGCAQLGQLREVKLEPVMKDLQEVTVSAHKTKIKIAGNDTRGTFLTAGFTKNNLGAEMAVKIRVKQPGTELRKFFVNVVNNKLDSVPLFRINIYKPDAKGAPGENILNKNIIVSPPGRTGLVEVDLKPMHIVTNEDLFISIEWIKDLGDVKGLYFSAKMGGETWYRMASQGDWHSVSALGIGLHAEIAY